MAFAADQPPELQRPARGSAGLVPARFVLPDLAGASATAAQDARDQARPDIFDLLVVLSQALREGLPARHRTVIPADGKCPAGWEIDPAEISARDTCLGHFGPQVRLLPRSLLLPDDLAGWRSSPVNPPRRSLLAWPCSTSSG